MAATVQALAACEPEAVARLIRRCAELHLQHVATSGDPFELGSARPLDFAHWVAHKLESLSLNRLRHGKTVAIGMAVDTVYAVKEGFLERAALERVIGLLEALGLRLWDDALDLAGPGGRPLVMDGLGEFHEHLGGELTVTLLREIGRVFEVHELHEDLVRESMDWLRRRERLR